MVVQNRQELRRLTAVSEFIRDFFTKSDWIKLAYITNSLALIENHPRLLRSLDFKEDDYEDSSFQVLSKMISESHDNLAEIERFVDTKKAMLDWSGGLQSGLMTALPDSPTTALQLIDRSRQGVSGAETERVAKLLGVTDKDMARLLNQSVATFHRHIKALQLDAPTSERLLLLTRLANYGESVFQDKGKFTRWLRRPLRILNDRSPLDLLDSPTGLQLVEDILGRIEYGVFS